MPSSEETSATSAPSPALSARIASVQVGTPRPFNGPGGTAMHSSIQKLPVQGSVWAGCTDVVGNRQHDLRYHGGPDKALCCWSLEHYAPVAEYLGRPLPDGAFGENLTLAGLLESQACLGDVFAVELPAGAGAPEPTELLPYPDEAELRLQISQPRQPCSTLASYLGQPKLPGFVTKRGCTGYYMRVLQEGPLAPGATLRLLARPWPQWTVARLNQVMFEDKNNREALRELAEHPDLAESWRETFRYRYKKLT